MPDPNPSSSWSKMNFKCNFSDKLIKFNNFSTKCSIKKYKFLFLKKKKIPQKTLYLVVKCNLINTLRRGYRTEVKFMLKNTRKNSCRILNQWQSDPDPKKIIPDPQHCLCPCHKVSDTVMTLLCGPWGSKECTAKRW